MEREWKRESPKKRRERKSIWRQERRVMRVALKPIGLACSPVIVRWGKWDYRMVLACLKLFW
jgi:hypothetical protein